MKMTDKIYDVLKFVCTILLPALSVLYVALSKLWGWPLADEIAGTLAAISVFIGAMIGISSNKYWNEVEAKDEE